MDKLIKDLEAFADRLSSVDFAFYTRKELREIIDRAKSSAPVEGDVVVYEKLTIEKDGCINLSDVEYLPTDCAGKTGSLVFRPDRGSK